MITRTDIIKKEIEGKNYKSYLEIGYQQGVNFNSIPIEHKVSIDTEPGATFTMTSDEFFAKNKEKFDVIFIDGDHSHAQSTSDLNHALNILSKGGKIFMHDTCPKDQEYASPGWCGEVFRTISDLANSKRWVKWRTYREDHGVTVIEKSGVNTPTGIEINSWAEWNENKDKIMNFTAYEIGDIDLSR